LEGFELPFVLLLVELPVLLAEFVDATCCVHELCLARVEGVALVADFHLNERVFIAVFPLDCFFCLCSGFAQERIIVAHVLEYHQAVVVGMDAFFHSCNFGSANLRRSSQSTYTLPVKIEIQRISNP